MTQARRANVFEVPSSLLLASCIIADFPSPCVMNTERLARYAL